jgi:branched-chain amino acid transport system substrate-binding protein
MAINKRLPAAAMLVVAFALVAAACGTSDDTTTTAAAAATTTTAEAAEETTTTEEMAEEPEFGALGGVIVPAGEDIQIRVSQTISGATEFLGVPNQRGVELAIVDYGDIAGHAVGLGTPQDSLCSSEGGQAVGQAIVAQEDVIGVIGTSCSSAGVAMSALISEAGMVMISPSNTSPALTSDLAGTAGSDYNPGYYRTAHNDLFQGAAVAEFVADQLGATTAATIHDGSSYAEGLVTAFAASFAELGGTITTATAVSIGDTDMVPVLTEVAAGSPEVLFFPIFMDEGGFISQQWDSVAGLEDTIQIGADGLLTDNYLEIPETLDNYLSGPNLDYGANVSETGVNAESFLATYEETYGEAPTAVFWAHSYDATVLLLTAIEAVAVDVDGSLFIDRQALRDAITATRDFSGIIGTMNCDDWGDCGSNKIAVVQNADPTDAPAAYLNIVFAWEPS